MATSTSATTSSGPLLHESNVHHDLVDSLLYIEGKADPNSAEARLVDELVAEEVRQKAAEHSPSNNDTTSHDTLEAGANIFIQSLGKSSNHLFTRADELQLEAAGQFVDEPAEISDSKGVSRDLLKQEFYRIMAKQQGMQKLDNTKYQNLDGPDQFSQGTEAAWKDALRNARLMAGCNDLRLANLELLLESGPKAAAEVRKANQSLEGQLTQEVAQLRKEAESINQKRKLGQISGQSELKDLQVSHDRYLDDNRKVEAAVLGLRKETERLKRMAKKRKVLPNDWRDPTINDAPKPLQSYEIVNSSAAEGGEAENGPQELNNRPAIDPDDL
ncbi:unnamed protein product [Amoebophrya sp. A120]|nr:unnamed protein product [Amoebophrya sp. A120]|eukprot:GSA120T00020125001.1